jgi:hypothetical protein
MSNLVLPTLPGADWNCTRTIIAPPVQIRTTPSQREYRARDATVPRYQYSRSYEFLRGGSSLEWQQLEEFFKLHGGDFESFRFSDPNDYQASAQQFGVADGSTVSYQLYRSLGGSFSEPVTEVAWAGVYENGAQANLLVNGSFEADVNSDGTGDNWTLYTSGTINSVTTARVTGPAVSESTVAQRITSTGLGTTSGDRIGVWQALSDGIFPSAPFVMSADILSTTAANLRMQVNWNTAAGAFITASVFLTTAPTGTRQRLSAPFVSPANAAKADVFITIESNPTLSAAQLNIDAAKLEYGTVAGAYNDRRVSVTSAGAVTFLSPPTAGATLTWSGEFWRRCRFLRGQLEVREFMRDYWEAKKVELISLKAGSQ